MGRLLHICGQFFEFIVFQFCFVSFRKRCKFIQLKRLNAFTSPIVFFQQMQGVVQSWTVPAILIVIRKFLPGIICSLSDYWNWCILCIFLIYSYYFPKNLFWHIFSYFFSKFPLTDCLYLEYYDDEMSYSCQLCMFEHMKVV